MRRPETVRVATYTGYPATDGAPSWVSHVSSRPASRLTFLRPVRWVWDQIHSVMLHAGGHDSIDLIAWRALKRHLDDILVSLLDPILTHLTFIDQGLYRQSEAYDRAVRNGVPRPRPRPIRRDPQFAALLDALRAWTLADNEDLTPTVEPTSTRTPSVCHLK